MNPDQVRDAIAQLSPEKRREFEAALRARGSASLPSNKITRRDDLSFFPLSQAQSRLWSLHRLRPGDAVYNIDTVWRLRGELHPDALESGFRTIIERHEPLRTRFIDESGRPVQSLRRTAEFHLDHIDLTGADDELLTKEIDRLTSQPFDLAEDFLLRATLVRLGQQDHVLVVVAHHIICDGWSLTILASELGAAYDSALAGTEPDLPPLPLAFADIAAWQLESEATVADLRYWEEKFKDGVEVLRLPRARPRKTDRGMAGRSLSFEIRPDLVQKVTDLARSQRTTLFAALLAGYQATLNRLTGQEILVLCTPVAGRSHPDMEPLIGYFNNLMPLLGDLRGDPTVAEMTVRAADTVAQAFDHASAPFQELASLPVVAATPLTRGLFVLQDGEVALPAISGVVATALNHDSSTSDFDLAVFLRPRQGALHGTVVFRPASLETEDVAASMADFASVLETIVQNPGRRLSELPMLNAPSGASVHQRSESAPETPSNPTEAFLQTLWRNAFRRPVRMDDDFFDLGGHSLLAAQLIAEIEAEFGLEALPLSTLFEAPTIRHFARLLENGVTEQQWESLVPIKPNGDRPPLFFVHAHGGNVIGYSGLGRHLSERQPLYGLQAPRGELGVRRIEDIAAAYVDEVRTVQPQGPYLLGGWCLGGDVAFEMARQLRRHGADVALVLMVDNPRPEHVAARHDLSRPLDRVATRVEMECANLAEAPQKGPYLLERVGSLAKRFSVEIERLATNRDGDLPFGLDHSRAYRQERVAAVHEKAYEDYVPEPYDGPVAVFRAELQPRGGRDDPTLGWSSLVEGPLLNYQLPGHRMGMLQEPRVARSAAIIEAAIADALGEGSS
jgi:thioesterase domain-containing protein/acyl carrier protein